MLVKINKYAQESVTIINHMASLFATRILIYSLMANSKTKLTISISILPSFSWLELFTMSSYIFSIYGVMN